MPGKRAEGVKTLGIPIHEDLWAAAKERAAGDGLPLVAVVRELLLGYVDGTITLPPADPVTPSPR
jgi:hypothetical protein